MVEANVEPDRRVECAVLIRAKPRQLVIKSFRDLGVSEITIGDTPVGDRASDAVNQLADGGFSSTLAWIGSVRDVTVKVFRDRDLGRERTPAFRYLDVLLFENDFAAVIRDLRSATLPFDLIEWLDFPVAENALKPETAVLPFRNAILPSNSRFLRFVKRGGLNSGFKLNHGYERGLRLRISANNSAQPRPTTCEYSPTSVNNKLLGKPRVRHTTCGAKSILGKPKIVTFFSSQNHL